ncbi:hypothetical protein [Planococcus shenhongbingii]|uniref:Uncharacterized protein n=1 Tax=Planococcus shenhongbingii TaxID=3058398 RepID=A0ABT8N7V7_9BACL|nr:hypothetical protein [Planococcus sp. N017]MDN7243972.1 hypothetical protein [Planococcus sp. N017]
MRTIQEQLIEKGLTDARIQEKEKTDTIRLANDPKKRSKKESKQKSWAAISFGTKDFKVVEQKESSIKLVLDIPKEEKDLIKKVFKADTAIVTFNPTEFIDRISNKAEESELGLVHGKVDYLDYSILDFKRKKVLMMVV